MQFFAVGESPSATICNLYFTTSGVCVSLISTKQLTTSDDIIRSFRRGTVHTVTAEKSDGGDSWNKILFAIIQLNELKRNIVLHQDIIQENYQHY